MTWRPSVDVVVATRNRPEFLSDALEGILSQDYEGEIHCIVVYDQSQPDLSLEQHEPGRRVSVIENTRTAGLAGARNSGIEAGVGQLVAFCDDDDIWLEGKLSTQVGQLVKQDASVVVTGITVAYRGRQTQRVPKATDMVYETILRKRVTSAHPSTVLVKRDVLMTEIGLVDEKIPGSYGEDFDWMLRAARVGPVATVERALVLVRWGHSQFSTNWQVIADSIEYGLEKNGDFSCDRHALGRLRGRRAFALAALGKRGEAIGEASRALRSAPFERRCYLAVLVALRLVTAERLLDLAHRRGRGI